MPGLLKKILPHERTFFEMFNHQAENVFDGASALVKMLERYDDPESGAEKIKEFEHIGDTITHNIMTRLNQTFITPFDREDIHELASKIDDVIDLVDAAASRLVTERVKTVPAAPDQTVAAVRILDKKEDHILDYCIEINRLENQSDRQCRDLIAT